MIKMYPGKAFRGRCAVRSAAVAFAVAWGAHVHSSQAVTETVWKNPAVNGTWSTSTNWTAGNPQGGWAASVFSSVNINFDVTAGSSVDMGTVQLAGGTTASPAEVTLNSANGVPFFQAANVLLGGSYSGRNGLTASAGPGEIVQSAGTLTVDPGGLLAVDPISTYILSGTGIVRSNNQQLFGTFSQSGTSNNNLSFGSIITNFGSYAISGGTNSADIIYNAQNTSSGVTYTGVYTQSAGTLQGSTGSNITFNNNSAYLYTGGTFIGTMINTLGATVNINTATIPFSQGLVNLGRTTVTGGTGSYAGPISGNGTLIFNGATSITLTGSSTFNGQTTISAGTVILAGPLGTNGSGGSLNGNIGISTGGTLQTNTDSQIANTSLVTINGGTLNLGGHDESIGSLNMTAGQVTQTSGLGLGVTSGLITINKGSANITGGLRSSNQLAFNIASNGSLTVGGNISGYNATAGSVLLTGGGLLSISANSMLSLLDVQNGFVQVTEGGTFGGSNPMVNLGAAGTINVGTQAVTIGNLTGSGAVGLATGSLILNGSGSTFNGTISGNGSLTKSGSGAVILNGNDLSGGVTNINTGTLTVNGSISGSIINVGTGTIANFNGSINGLPTVNANGTANFSANPNAGILRRSIGALNVGSNATSGNGQVNLLQASVHANRELLAVSSLTLAGASGAWTSRLDLSNNDLLIRNGNYVNVSDQVKSGFAIGQWNGTGLNSSAANADSRHITALGAILNDDGLGNALYSTSSALGSFDGISPSVTDVLVKFTYYGDANLDGKVDGSDYTRIDNTFASGGTATGWFNGDFNYDGTVNGTDYTLIDNAFNTQGNNLSTSAEIAHVTAEIAGTSAVPEPTSLVAAFTLGFATLGRRRRV